MSNILQIKNLFYSSFPFSISTFKDCSFDSSNNVHLVMNETECLNFDIIKRSCGHSCTSCDSLFFSYKSSAVLFIEFKNSSLRNSFENIGKSACDSFYIYFNFLHSRDMVPAFIGHDYRAVISSNKNGSSSNSAVAAMINRSSKDGEYDFFDFYCEEAEKISKNKMKREHGNDLPNDLYYNSFKIVLSHHFDEMLSMYI